MKIKKMKCMFIGMVSLLTLISCGGKDASNDSNNIITSKTEAITIDNAGIVPILAPSSSTTTVVYVHNNTNQRIDNISYDAYSEQLALQSKSSGLLQKIKGFMFDENELILPTSIVECKSIVANGSCALAFRTPEINNSMNQGSMIISGHYKLNNKVNTFSRLLNYQIFDNIAPQNGVDFSSSVDLFANNPYGVLYVYGKGYNKNYKVKKLSLDNPAIEIVNGNITDHEVSSMMIQPIEVKSVLNTNQETKYDTMHQLDGITAKINMTVNDGVLDSSSFANISASPVNPQGVLVAGYVPYINTSLDESPSSFVTIYNAGSQNATLGTPFGTNGIVIANNSCPQSLSPGSSCNIKITVPASTNNNGTLTVPAIGGISAIVNISWFSSTGGNILEISPSASPFVFNAGVGGTNVITISSANNTAANNLSVITTTKSGSATNSSSPLNCFEANLTTSTGTNLVIGGVCKYTLNESDMVAETGFLNLKITGTSPTGSNNLNRNYSLAYTSNNYTANVSIQPQMFSWAINGNNTESSTQLFRVINAGPGPANKLVNSISGTAVTSNDVVMISNNCNNVNLNATESCSFVLKLGPSDNIGTNAVQRTLYQTESFINPQSGNGLFTDSVTTILNPLDVANFKIISVSVEGNSNPGVDGSTSESAFLFPGSNGSLLIFSYKNTTGSTIGINGIINNNNPYYWTLDPVSTTCAKINDPTYITNITNGSTCTIAFDNNINSYASTLFIGSSSSMVENIVAPLFVISSGTKLYTNIQPTYPSSSGNISYFYATANLATLTNSVVKGLGGNYNYSSSLSNASGYSSPIQVNATLNNMYLGLPVVTGAVSCNNYLESSASIINQNCVLNNGANNSLTAIYTYNSIFGIGRVLSYFTSISSGGNNYGILQNTNMVTTTVTGF